MPASTPAHRRPARLARLAPLALAALAALSLPLAAIPPPADLPGGLDIVPVPEERVPEHLTPCVGGFAGPYPCNKIDLLESLPLSTFGAGAANSLWGWTDPVTGHEIALLGLDNGTAFVDIADPEEPVYLGKLPTSTGTSIWRDVRTYGHYAYIVADQDGAHGMQVFDLDQLRSVVSPPVTFTETAHYGQINNTHTIWINEETGFAYLVGTNTCGTGMHMVNLANPTAPTFAGCGYTTSYVHENQCVVYHGPDTTYTGHEICLPCLGSTHKIAILDVTNKSAPVVLKTLQYNNSGYSHQGTLTDDQRYYILDDELDEENQGNPTRTYVFDVSDLDNPVLVGFHDAATLVIDHNQYVHGEYLYQSNYQAGFRIQHLDDLATASMSEVAFFDIYPASNDPQFNGNWNNYRFPGSGNVIVSGIEQGLFVLRPILCTAPPAPTALDAVGNGDFRIDTTWTGTGTVGNTFRLERALGGCGGSFSGVAANLVSPFYADTAVSGTAPYGYRVREVDPSGLCPSAPSACDAASTTGACTTGPAFAGVATATNPAGSTCSVELSWSAATSFCGGPATYAVYRGTAPGFVPGEANRIASGIAGSSFTDFGVDAFGTYYYVVRATDSGNGAEEGNGVELSVKPTGPLADGTFATGAEVGDPPLDSSASRSVEHVGWHISTARAHAGLRSFYSTSSDNLCVSLVTPPLTLTAGQSSNASFWTGWDLENRFDGGVVEVSNNGGSSWTMLTPAGGYPNTFTVSSDACGYATNTGCFTGLNQLTFQQKSVSLASYSGQSVMLRFNFSTDGASLGEGWYVDDLAITHAQVPGTCVGTTLFRDGFEVGSFTAWSGHTP